jgi:serine protease Do
MRKFIAIIIILLALTGCVSVQASEPYVPVSDVERLRINSIEESKGFTVSIINSNSSGTGIIFNSDDNGYYILTAAHVATSFATVYHDETKGMYDGSLVNEDIVYDLAVVYIETNDVLPVYNLNIMTTPTIGQDIYAIGNPMGKFNYVVTGVITYTDTGYRLLNNVAFMHDAFVSEGFSGGGLFNLYGELIGINVATINDNMALSLNLNAIRNIIEELSDKN